MAVMKRICTIKTPYLPMSVIADDSALYALSFADQEDLLASLPEPVEGGKTIISEQVEAELDQYFTGRLTHFTVPLSLIGTSFQQQVWRALQKIPYGHTVSYADLAAKIGRPRAFRAVANANGRNRIPIIIPCHRVIYSNGKLGGYTGGIRHKQQLLAVEQVAQTEIRETVDLDG